jgi:hypothetical protein
MHNILDKLGLHAKLPRTVGRGLNYNLFALEIPQNPAFSALNSADLADDLLSFAYQAYDLTIYFGQPVTQLFEFALVLHGVFLCRNLR